MTEWIRNKTGIFTSTISSLNDLEKFKKRSKVTALGLFNVYLSINNNRFIYII
jgi:hypothetical protein